MNEQRAKQLRAAIRRAGVTEPEARAAYRQMKRAIGRRPVPVARPRPAPHSNTFEQRMHRALDVGPINPWWRHGTPPIVLKGAHGDRFKSRRYQASRGPSLPEVRTPLAALTALAGLAGMFARGMNAAAASVAGRYVKKAGRGR